MTREERTELLQELTRAYVTVKERRTKIRLARMRGAAAAELEDALTRAGFALLESLQTVEASL